MITHSALTEWHSGDVDTSSTGLDGAHGMALDAAGNIYVGSHYTDSVIRIDNDTLAASIFVFPGTGGLEYPTNLAFDEDGNLLVCSWGTGSVLKYDQFGNFDSVVISPANDGGLNGTWGLLLYTPDDTCKADFNEDGTVNTQDFLAFLGAWSAGAPLTDWNGDGDINTLDFFAFLGDWAAGCP